MSIPPRNAEPADAAARRAVEPVTVYAVDSLPAFDRTFYDAVRTDMTLVDELTVPPRDGRAFEVPAGHLFRIVSVEGPQVGDLNLWSSANLQERFYSGKTRALHATHVSTGDRLWSSIPWLRPMATIHARHAGLVRLRRVRGRRPRRHRHPLRPLHQPPADRWRLPLLLPFQPHARPGSGTKPAAGRSGRPRARRGQRVHVHRLHAWHEPVLHEGEPGARGGTSSSSLPRSTCWRGSPPVRAATAAPGTPATRRGAIHCGWRSSGRRRRRWSTGSRRGPANTVAATARPECRSSRRNLSGIHPSDLITTRLRRPSTPGSPITAATGAKNG